MNQIDHNGPALKYQLTVQKEGQGLPETLMVDDWRNNTVEISASQAYFPYNVKMIARNSEGESSAQQQNLTLYSYEDCKTITL